MINISESIIRKIFTQHISKSNLLNNNCFEIVSNEEEDILLKKIFLKPFTSTIETYEFSHEIDIALNPLFSIVNKLHEGTDSEQTSSAILKHLLNVSRHPNIKDGDILIIQFDDIIIDKEYYSGIGIYKIENKDSFVEINFIDDKPLFKISQGINGRKIDKACLIVFTEKPYTIFIIDNVAGTDYWQKDFINITNKNDDINKTFNILNCTKSFISDKLPQITDISKVEQAILLNKSQQYLSSNNTFNADDFESTVIVDCETISHFREFKSDFESKNNLDSLNSFSISNSAVKKEAKRLKSIIKLDKNFHIYIHGSNQFIQKGYDEKTGMNFYQLFFKEEL